MTPSIPPFSSITQAKLALFSLKIFSADKTVVYSGRYITSFTKFSTSTESELAFKLKRSFTYTIPNVSSNDSDLDTGILDILFSSTICFISFISIGSDKNNTSTLGVIISLIGRSEKSSNESIISLSAGNI